MLRNIILTLIFTCSTLFLGMAAHADNRTSQQDDGDALTRLLSDRGLLARAQDSATNLVDAAIGFLGIPYRFGGSTESSGFDCSGLVRAIYAQTVGKILPRSAAEQAAATTEIDKSELKPGDLVFFNTMRRTFSHVGIYIGNNKFIHAPRTGANVRVDDMNLSYWRSRFDGARRVEETN